jgi:hypothetical protein
MSSRRSEKVFPKFPYDKKFTREEIAEILERAKRIGRAMRDGQGPNGAILGMPADLFELWMIHGALAGVDVIEEKAYIRPRVITGGMYGDAVEWVLKKEDTPEALERDLQREAAAHAAHIEAMPPKLRAAVLDMFTKKADRVADRAADSTVAEADALAVAEEAARAKEAARIRNAEPNQGEEGAP